MGELQIIHLWIVFPSCSVKQVLFVYLEPVIFDAIWHSKEVPPESRNNKSFIDWATRLDSQMRMNRPNLGNIISCTKSCVLEITSIKSWGSCNSSSLKLVIIRVLVGDRGIATEHRGNFYQRLCAHFKYLQYLISIKRLLTKVHHLFHLWFVLGVI